MNTAKQQNGKSQSLLPFKEVAGMVRQKIQGMDDETLVRTIVQAGLVEGLSMPGLAKASTAVPAAPPSAAEIEVEEMILSYLKTLGRGASSTEVSENVACDNKEKVVRTLKRLAGYPAGHERKVHRAGPHKYTRYALTKTLAKKASGQARHAA